MTEADEKNTEAGEKSAEEKEVQEQQERLKEKIEQMDSKGKDTSAKWAEYDKAEAGWKDKEVVSEIVEGHHRAAELKSEAQSLERDWGESAKDVEHERTALREKVERLQQSKEKETEGKET